MEIARPHQPRMLATLTALVMVFVLAVATPARAIGAFDNGLVATKAEAYPDGTWYGWCKVFVNDMLRQASGGQIQLSGYVQGYIDAGAVEVTSANATRGDVIQVTPAGSVDGNAESLYDARENALHTAIILTNNGGGNFWVIDSNWKSSEPKKVFRHSFNPYTWTAAKQRPSDVRIWRFGTVSTAGGSAGSSLSVNVTSQLTDGGSVQHVYTGTSTGGVYETWWSPTSNGTHTSKVGTVSGAVTAISSQVTGGSVQHVYTGTSTGGVYETWWSPTSNGTQTSKVATVS